MKSKGTLLAAVLLLVLIHLQISEAIWFPWYFHRYGLEPHSARHKGAGGGGVTASAAPSGKQTMPPSRANKDKNKGGPTCPPGYELKDPKSVREAGSATRICDDNPVLMQLARLYVVSPERIVLLLAQPSLVDSCAEIRDVLANIHAATSKCVLAPDNIYGKLSDGLDYFKEVVCESDCEGSSRKRFAGLLEAQNCIREMRTDMIECEAPPDWYETRNKSKLCQIYNDVLDCYYTRAAMLCGIESAKQLRSFAADSMGRAMNQKCEVSKKLPRVDNAMPSMATSSSPMGMAIVTLVLIVIFC
ncbi:uncharacterized protein LOC117900480 [Drosophila subobscura]|uniref:uncharacterized protein LOC117900480 n=1 Tax=Drosophila subobscura TaxID=7241 RepID=UPI00155B273E|nr:uncharacterized protein LOC117900480 [Drosophila subobscura]